MVAADAVPLPTNIRVLKEGSACNGCGTGSPSSVRTDPAIVPVVASQPGLGRSNDAPTWSSRRRVRPSPVQLKVPLTPYDMMGSMDQAPLTLCQ